MFPAALAIADDPLNFGDRAEKMNESNCSNTACVIKRGMNHCKLLIGGTGNCLDYKVE